MKYFLMSLLLVSTNLFALNGRKCDNLMRKKTFWGLPSFLTTSSAQFTSSTGECSVLGDNKEEQKRSFYFANIEQLKNEIARGSGENLTTLFLLNGCPKKTGNFLEKQLQKNIEAILIPDKEKSYSNFLSILGSHCNSFATSS